MKQRPIAPALSPLASALTDAILNPRRALPVTPFEHLASEVAAGLRHAGWPGDARQVAGGVKSGNVRRDRQAVRQALVALAWEAQPDGIRAHPRSDRAATAVLRWLERARTDDGKPLIDREMQKLIAASPDTIRNDLLAIGARSEKRRGKSSNAGA